MLISLKILDSVHGGMGEIYLIEYDSDSTMNILNEMYSDKDLEGAVEKASKIAMKFGDSKYIFKTIRADVLKNPLLSTTYCLLI